MLRKPPVVKTNEQKKAERTKHEQNRKMCEKKGFPKFDMFEANKLMEGQYHEDDEDDIEETEKILRNKKEIHFQTYQEKKHEEMLAKFEVRLKGIMAQEDHDRILIDEVPHALRK